MNRVKTLLRTAATGATIAALLGLSSPAVASAHPLGNFTVNRYDGLTVAASWAHLDRVVDMAELPTVQARQQMDTDRDDSVSNAEAAAWASSTCNDGAADISLAVDGRSAAAQPVGVGVSFPEGQAGLPTLRLVCTYSLPLAGIPAGAQISFRDDAFAGETGWREIVVAGAGVELAGIDQYTTSASDRLRSYPAEASSQLREQAAALFSVIAVTTEVAQQPLVADAVPLASPADSIVSASAAPGAVPDGSEELPAQITALLQANDLSPVAVIIALIVAAALGAFHAATPGHGKTLMAAYLVGTRGTVRHAMGLGLTVTVTHTIGVLALGIVVIALGATLPAVKLFPVLGLASGIIVTVLGATFLAQRLRSRRTAAAAHAHAGAHDHEHGHDHGHEHESGHGHPEGEHHSHAVDESAGWHSHGPLRHTHLPAAEGPLRRRNLVALGLVGGLVPSASAVLILVGSIAAGRPAFGLLLTIAFGAGMAFVLVGVGVLLVRARFLVERLGSRRLEPVMAYAPLVTALTFVVVGAVITFQSGAQLR